jgi:hypothetical protein
MARSANCLLRLGPLGTDHRRKSRGHDNVVNRSKIQARSYRALRVCGLLLVSIAVYGQTLALPAAPTENEDGQQLSFIEEVNDGQVSSSPHFEFRFGVPSTIDRSCEDSDRSSPGAGSVELLQPQNETKPDINLKFRVANQEALLFTGIHTPAISRPRREHETRSMAIGCKTICTRSLSCAAGATAISSCRPMSVTAWKVSYSVSSSAKATQISRCAGE